MSEFVYERREKFGTGLLGDQWVGEHVTSHTPVVLELIPAVKFDDVAFQAVLASSGKQFALFHHKFVLDTFDIAELEDGHYLASGLPTGVSVASPQSRVLLHDPAQRELFVVALCETLQAMHDHNVVHGGMSTQTVWITDDKTPLISETAIASAIATAKAQRTLRPVVDISAAALVISHLYDDALNPGAPEYNPALLDVLREASSPDTHAESYSANALREDILHALHPDQQHTAPAFLELPKEASAPSVGSPTTTPTTAASGTSSPAHLEMAAPQEAKPRVAAAAPKRHHRIRNTILGVILIAIIAAGATTGWFYWLQPTLNSGPLKLAGAVRLTATPMTGSCTTLVVASASGSTSGMGNLHYAWIDAMGSNAASEVRSPELTLNITKNNDGFKLIHQWHISTNSSFKGDVAIDILSPSSVMRTIPISITCGS